MAIATPKTLPDSIFLFDIYTAKLIVDEKRKRIRPLMIFLMSFGQISFRFPATRIDKEEQRERERKRESGESCSRNFDDKYLQYRAYLAV